MYNRWRLVAKNDRLGFLLNLLQAHRSVHWKGDMRMDNLELPSVHPKGAKLVSHPAFQPGTEVVDPSKGNQRFTRVRGAGIRPSGAGF